MSIDELKSTGAVEAPIVKGSSKRPVAGLTRVWVINGQRYSYTVPLPDKVRKAKAAAIRWDNRKRELDGEGVDGIACSVMYGPLPRPVEHVPTERPESLFKVSDECNVCGQVHRKLC